MADIEKIAEDLSNLTVLEAAELAKLRVRRCTSHDAVVSVDTCSHMYMY